MSFKNKMQSPIAGVIFNGFASLLLIGASIFFLAVMSGTMARPKLPKLHIFESPSEKIERIQTEAGEEIAKAYMLRWYNFLDKSCNPEITKCEVRVNWGTDWGNSSDVSTGYLERVNGKHYYLASH